MRAVPCMLVLALLLWQVSATPTVLGHDPSSHPQALAAVSELTSRVTSGVPRLNLKDGRLPVSLPGPQDIEAIKKVAQILAMLGEQVIPAIIGEPGSGAGACDPVEDTPNDAVTDN